MHASKIGSSNVTPKFVWPHEGVLLLLEEYSKVEHEFYLRRKRHGTLWEEIAIAVRNQSDLNVTGIQCQQKISSLKRTYTNIKENISNYKAGEWPYFPAVEELFGNKDSEVIPVAPRSAGAERPYTDNDEINSAETCNSDGDKLFFLWTHKGVLSLLEKYKEVEHEFYSGRRRHKEIWNEIAEAVHAANSNLKVTGIQCSQKISGMKRTYWGIKETHPCPSAGTVPWLYFAAADEIFYKEYKIIFLSTSHNKSPRIPKKQRRSISSPSNNDDYSETCTSDPNKKKLFSWSYSGVLLLLEQYREVEHEFYLTNKRHSLIWDEIAEALQTIDSNLKPTGLQCQQKISGMKRTYMNIKDHHPCPNTYTVSWPFFTIIDELFGNGTEELEMRDSEDDSNPKPYMKTIKRISFKWPHRGVLLLLKKFKAAQMEFSLGEKKHTKIWDEIAAAVQASSMLKPTGVQCQQKINGLKRIYAVLKENHSGLGTDKDSWPYYTVMDEIFGNQDNVPVQSIACSTGPEMQKAVDAHLSSSDDENNSGICVGNEKKKALLVWSYKAVLLLLEQYGKVKHEFFLGEKRHSQIWNEIAEAMQDSGYKVADVQCKQKLHSLKQTYTALKKKRARFSMDRVCWPFFSAMDGIFGKVSVGRPHVLRKLKYSSLSSSTDDGEEYDGNSRQLSHAKKRRECTQRMFTEDIPDDLELMRLQRERKQQEREERRYKINKLKMKQINAMHKEKLDVHKAALEILNEILLKQ